MSVRIYIISAYYVHDIHMKRGLVTLPQEALIKQELQETIVKKETQRVHMNIPKQLIHQVDSEVNKQLNVSNRTQMIIDIITLYFKEKQS